MEKSRLKPHFAAQLLEKKNETKLLKIAIHFKVTLASFKQAIRRQSEYLTTPAYEVKIQKALGVRSNVKISEIYNTEDNG